MIIALVLTFEPINRTFPIHFSNKRPEFAKTESREKLHVNELKVFSFNTNIMGQARLSRLKESVPVIDIVRESGADIVCLQEYAFSLNKKGHTELQLRDELRDIYPYYDFTLNDNCKTLGIATYSKYPIRKGTRIDKRKKGYFSAMYYQIEVNGQFIGLVNMHLRSNKIATKDRVLADEMIDHFEADSLSRIRSGMMRSFANALRVRSEEADSIYEFLSNNHPEKMPLLICGDMNDAPISYCHHRICEYGLEDTWKEVGTGLGHTYRMHHFWFRIDHMFHNKRLNAINMQVNQEVLLSDHYPIEATFQILPE